MKYTFTFLRKPLKLIFITILMILLSTTMLVFCLQSFLDGLVMEHSMNSTAYVGSIYSHTQDYPMLKDIPTDVLRQLEDSDTVEKVMNAHVYSAKAEGLTRVVDAFGILESLNQKLFVEGIVSDKPTFSYSQRGKTENFSVKTLAVWGGNWSGESVLVHLMHDLNPEVSHLEVGDHVFLVGRYNFNFNGDAIGLFQYAPEVLEFRKLETDSAFWNYPILVLPENLNEEESASLIQSFLQESGLEDSLNMMDDIQNMFTLHQVEDMSMLPTVADGTTFITQGRELHTADTGKYVCVLNEAVARKNGLAVGDMISLSIADGCYVFDDNLSKSGFEHRHGWESGYPFEGDTLLEYREYNEFEIVGFYSEVERIMGGTDYLHYNRNDIFIPGGILPEPADAQARAVTFRVLGPNYEDFMNTFEVSLNEQGYTLNLIDTGWETISSSFYAMSDRRILLQACSIVIFMAAVVTFAVLLSYHFRYEFALRRLLGAMPGEARRIYVSGFLFTAIPSGLVAMLGSFGVYWFWLKKQATASLPMALPANGSILSYLAGWICLELVAAFVVLMVLSFITNKQSLIRLLK